MAKSHKSQSLAAFFAALADPTRLRLLNLMHGREVCVCYFVSILRQSQPKISRHLAYLRRAGIVAARREGKWMHYSLSAAVHPATENILQTTFESLRNDPLYQSDSKQLERVCCAPGDANKPLPTKLVSIRK